MVEKSKYKTSTSEAMIDRGYVGHKSAKMMKKSKVIEQRTQKAIEEKENLLRNIDKNEELKIIHVESRKSELILVNNLQIKYNEKPIFEPITFDVKNQDRIAIVRKKRCSVNQAY